MKGKKDWNQIQWISNKLGHPALDDEQQLQQQQQYSNTQSSIGSSSGSCTLYAYTCIPGIIYQVLELLGCETTYGAIQEEKWKQMTHEKKKAFRIEMSTWYATGKGSTRLTTQFLTYLRSTSTHLYIRIDAWDRNNYFGRRNQNSAPRRKTTRTRPRPLPEESGEAIEGSHDQQTAHRMVDLISS